jgi:hypothetical protein
MDVEMLLMMQEALMGAISGRGPLRCSSEFLSTWATIVKECFPGKLPIDLIVYITIRPLAQHKSAIFDEGT